MITIKSNDLLIDTVRILSKRHWRAYNNESVVSGNREVAVNARKALDTYAFALSRLETL